MRCNSSGKTLLIAAILLFTMLLPVIQPVSAAGGGGGGGEEDMQAQNTMAMFNSESEDTTVMWENVPTGLIYISERLQ